jgi:hypothetical protein
VTDVIPIANFRTRLEAELAARLLEGAAVPYVINSQEGMLHGPLGDGATILVRSDDVELAREVLAGSPAQTPPRVVRVATCPNTGAAERVRAALSAAGIPVLSTADPAQPDADRHVTFVPAGHGARARRTIQTAMLEP